MKRLKAREESVKVKLEMRNVVSKEFYFSQRKDVLPKGKVELFDARQISTRVISKSIKAFFSDAGTSKNNEEIPKKNDYPSKRMVRSSK